MLEQILKKSKRLELMEISDPMNYQYMTYLEFGKDESCLCVIDNIDNGEIKLFILDKLTQSAICPAWFVSMANHWYYHSSEKYPLSIEFSKNGMSQVVTPIYATIPLSSVRKITGRVFSYPLSAEPEIRRRRVKAIPSNVEISLKPRQAAA